MNTYQAAQSHAVWLDHSTRGRLLLTDRDRLDLMNRISTNKLIDLPTHHSRRTVFLNANARILQHVWVLNQGDTVLVITEPDAGNAFEGLLRRNIFWNDKLVIDNVSASLHQIGVYGPKSTQIVTQWWATAATLNIQQALQDDRKTLWRIEDLADNPAYWLIGSEAFIEDVKAHLATIDAPQVTPQAYDVLRIASGIPAAQHELTDAYIPLELGLWDAVSFNKGCYTGQEIIARMESRGKLARMLVKIESEQQFVVGDTLLNDAGKQAGTITSAAIHPETNTTIGLAVVKSDAATTMQNLTTTNDILIRIVGHAGIYETQYT